MLNGLDNRNNKTKNGFAMELKFNDIVVAAGLNAKSAQYVLRSPAAVPDMPSAGQQGVHREFTYSQALRLAQCTRLLQAGVALKYVSKIVGYCEEEVRHRERPKPGKTLFASKWDDPWYLRIFDDRYLQVWRDGLRTNEFRDEDEVINFTTWTKKKFHGNALSTYQLDLTALERKIVIAVKKANSTES